MFHCFAGFAPGASCAAKGPPSGISDSSFHTGKAVREMGAISVFVMFYGKLKVSLSRAGQATELLPQAGDFVVGACCRRTRAAYLT